MATTQVRFMRLCSRALRLLRHAADVVEGAIQSLPPTIWWRFYLTAEISNDLFEAFLYFTRHQGWDKTFEVWVAGARYTDVGHVKPIYESGLRLFALVLEYAADKVRSTLAAVL